MGLCSGSRDDRSIPVIEGHILLWIHRAHALLFERDWEPLVARLGFWIQGVPEPGQKDSFVGSFGIFRPVWFLLFGVQVLGYRFLGFLKPYALKRSRLRVVSLGFSLATPSIHLPSSFIK